MRNRFLTFRGFTLIELLVVIAIIAVLAGLLVPVASRVQARGRTTKCAHFMRQLGTAYRTENAYTANGGSFITMQMTNVTGPAGAQFSFWDEHHSTVVPQVTFTVGGGFVGNDTVNLTNASLIIGNGSTPLPALPNTGFPYAFGAYAPATNGLPSGFTWNDDDGAGPQTAVSDPYGHIHGRSWTANQPGTYTVDYILHDASGQHADSAPFIVTYGAVPEPGTAALLAGGLAALGLVRRRRAVR